MTAPGLAAAFDAYEHALMTNDVEALDRLFAPGPATLRGDVTGLLVGHDAISAFRRARGGAPPRRIVETHVREIDDEHALIVAVTELLTGGRGQQTQLWEHRDGTWVITAAHVSSAAAALDGRIWRLVGDPLLPRSREGSLSGESVAVKDLYAVAGQRVGAGNPARLEAAEPEPEHAWAVERLLAEGADVRGISRTDEFAFGLAGTDTHYGAPPNPRAAQRVPGGSSSGSASAVSLGHATIGLGTDTGGSVRVPAAYQGLWGIRTTHGAVSVRGLLPLSPSFDTVGWLTKGPALLSRVAGSLLPPDETTPGDSVTAEALLGLAEPDIAESIRALVADIPRIDWTFDSSAMLTTFQTLQAYEAWQVHGPWLTTRWDTLRPDVRGRFERAAAVSTGEADRARREVAVLRIRIRELLRDRVLVLPSASSVAPPVHDSDAVHAIRTATMQLTCIAGIAGLPAVSVPGETRAGLPFGMCLVGPPRSDRGLIALAERWHRRSPDDGHPDLTTSHGPERDSRDTRTGS
ncbi:AtzH-like domain-containing protein [Nocardia sp. NPDC024068]|uniref:AtzH-like domain-containing protein n=1 Tax=Nocardia sp. NPDC024068 TaxID=3157197 RepID=UPI00340FEE5B